MLKKLSKSQKFLDELAEYNSKLSQIVDLKKRDEVLSKINQLKTLVENIDSAHKALYGFQIKPSLLTDTREQIILIRRELRNILDIR